MLRAAKLGRTERSKLEEVYLSTLIPLNQVIIQWYKYLYRHPLIKELKTFAESIQSGEEIEISLRTYNRFLEVVRTELVNPFPVRAGA